MSKAKKIKQPTDAISADSMPRIVNVSGAPSGYTRQTAKPGFAKNDNPPNSPKGKRRARLVDKSAEYRASLTDLYSGVIAVTPTAGEIEAAQARADGLVLEPPDSLRAVVGGNVKGVHESPMGTSATRRVENVSAEPSSNVITMPREYAGAVRGNRGIPQGLVYPGDGPHGGLEPAPLTDYILYPEGPPAYGCTGDGICAGHCGGQCAANASWAFRQMRRAAAR